MAEPRLPGRSLRRTLSLATGTLSGCLCAVALGGAALGLAHTPQPGPYSSAGAWRPPRPPRPRPPTGSAVPRTRTPGTGARPTGRPAPPMPRWPDPRRCSWRCPRSASAHRCSAGHGQQRRPGAAPFSQPRTAGWLRDSVTPGEAGTAVLVGHVDTRTGPAVMWNLSAVRPGALVEVSRLDGTTALFTVDRLKSYAKAAFPATLVYGPTSDAELRIITCGGGFDRARQEYTGNVVLFAHLSGVR
ncbi:class F sortase [Streptacidiphilus sp. 4-A2]|nr:class F sortase [Streptacidiphilus sp. 4-A2]